MPCFTGNPFSAVLAKEGKWYVAHCPEVGVSSQGKTRKSALKNLREAVELYLEDDPVGTPENPEKIEKGPSTVI